MPKATRLNRNLSNQDKLFFTLLRDNPRWGDLKRCRYNSEKMADYVELLNNAYVKKFASNEEVGRVIPKYGMRDNEDEPYTQPPPRKNRKNDQERFEQEVSERFYTFWKDIESTYQAHKEEIHNIMRARQESRAPDATPSPCSTPFSVNNIVQFCSTTMSEEDKKQLLRVLIESLGVEEGEKVIAAFAMIRSSGP